MSIEASLAYISPWDSGVGRRLLFAYVGALIAVHAFTPLGRSLLHAAGRNTPSALVAKFTAAHAFVTSASQDVLSESRACLHTNLIMLTITSTCRNKYEEMLLVDDVVLVDEGGISSEQAVV